MSFHRSKIDLMWSTAGDIVLDINTLDLKDTTSISYRALIQQVQAVIESTQGEWRLEPEVGANLKKFIGQQANRDLSLSIQEALYNGLTRQGILKRNEIRVEIFPLSKQKLGILLVIIPAGDSKQINLTYTYDVSTNQVLRRN